MTEGPESTSLGGRVMRSTIWLLLSSLVARGLSFVTQIVLAFLLVEEEFGTYAIAISVSAFLTNFAGGGSIQWMVQGGRQKLAERAVPTWWVCLSTNVLLGALIASVAAPAARFFGVVDLREMLLVIAVAQPLSTIPTYFNAVLSIDLRMREFAIADGAGSIVRYAMTIGLALAGAGPMAFVLPLPVTYLVAGLISYSFVATRPWKGPLEARKWPALVFANRWVLTGTAVITLGLQVDYAILGRLADLRVVGLYFFAFQLSYMTASIVTQNIRVVLLPGFVSVEDGRRNEAILRACALAMMVGTPLLLVLAAVIEPLEDLVWGGRWEESVFPIQILCLGLPIHLLTAITHSSLQSEARFRRWTGVNAIRALCVLVGASVAGVFFGQDVNGVALVLTTALVAGDAAVIVFSLRAHGLSLPRVLRVFGPLWLWGILALLAALSTAHFVESSWAEMILGLLCFVITYLAFVIAFARPHFISVRSEFSRFLRASRHVSE